MNFRDMQLIKCKVPKLTVSIYDSDLGNCSNNGISAYFNRVDLVEKPEPYEPGGNPRVVIVERSLFGGTKKYMTAYPVDFDGTVRTDGMAGGTFIYSTDSRFPFDYPVSLHDRFE